VTLEPLVLASASPARLATLRAAGVEPRVVVSGVDESVVRDGDVAVKVVRLAELKGRSVLERLEPGHSWLLACDSLLDLDGEPLGRPRDAGDAVRRWRRMRGRSGLLRTGHFLVDLATGEPLEVAGAFTVDGRGGPFVTGIEGDHHNVVGVSLPAVREMLAELGGAWTDLWGAGPDR
jgi:septum formation protein